MISRRLVITEAAESLQLLSIEDMRALAGISGSGSDAALTALGLSVAAAIAAECNIAVGSGGETPTLNRETLTETFRNVRGETLVLSRRHAIDVASVEVDGTVLDEAAYEVDGESGILTRIETDCPSAWWAKKIVVAYDAGFSTVPADLAMAAKAFFRLAWQESQRDPSVRAVEREVEGIDRVRTEYWVGSLPGQSKSTPVPDLVAGQLARFRNFSV